MENTKKEKLNSFIALIEKNNKFVDNTKTASFEALCTRCEALEPRDGKISYGLKFLITNDEGEFYVEAVLDAKYKKGEFYWFENVGVYPTQSTSKKNGQTYINLKLKMLDNTRITRI